jgi:hypothetical protein
MRRQRSRLNLSERIRVLDEVGFKPTAIARLLDTRYQNVRAALLYQPRGRRRYARAGRRR